MIKYKLLSTYSSWSSDEECEKYVYNSYVIRVYGTTFNQIKTLKILKSKLVKRDFKSTWKIQNINTKYLDNDIVEITTYSEDSWDDETQTYTKYSGLSEEQYWNEKWYGSAC